jgi:dynein heavy chain
MMNLFTKITNQMIVNCKQCILDDDEPDKLWDKDPLVLIKNLESCLKMNESYQEQYRVTKDKLLTLPKGKQFDFSETVIFGRFDLFCRRVVKLIDMFSTIHQFRSLSKHRFDGMEQLVLNFKSIMEEFRNKRHDLLDFLNNRFDRDYVEFNVRISDLESALQQFINQSFESISSIETSLKLLKKFKSILQRDSLRADLESKYVVIFHNYGLELTQVQDQYEKQKSSPPLVRNLPPVAGNITWSRHLLRRIEEPMKKFQSNPTVLGGKDAKKIIRMYNKMAKTLVEFETLWYQAWVVSIDAAKNGLGATLIVRHPDDQKPHVNFDWDILQLIREAKCLSRMGIEIPESARMVLLQELKFKQYFNTLQHILKEYRRVIQMVRPISANLLKPHLDNLEFMLRPGMVALKWTSMNIDQYIHNVWLELTKLEQLVRIVNDMMESRIDANLKHVNRIMLVDLPQEADGPVGLDDFVDIQERHVRDMTGLLMSKSQEIEMSVNDMLGIIVEFPLDAHVRGISESEIIKVKAHYNWSMYQALLTSTKRSLSYLKRRLSSRPDSMHPDHQQTPFFDVDLQLDGNGVRLAPSIEEIQSAVNGGAVAILKCSKMIEAWDTVTIPKNVQLILNPNLPPVLGTGSQGTFYDRVAQDKEILKVILLLTGSIQCTRDSCVEYLTTFNRFQWLWKEVIADEYKVFQERLPTLDEFESKLRSFVFLDEKLDAVETHHDIASLSLKTRKFIGSLKELCNQWKLAFSKELHVSARGKLENLSEVIKQTMKRMSREVTDGDIDALGFVMSTLTEVRKKESEIELELQPITHMYTILDTYLPPSMMDKDEADARLLLPSNWAKLSEESRRRQNELSKRQAEYKKTLISTVNTFKRDVRDFRKDYEARGPMVTGIPPREAVERLRRYKEEFEVRSRRQEIYYLGEDLFGLPHQQYPALELTKKELGFLAQLYELYVQVVDTIAEWRDILWIDVPEQMETMQKLIDNFGGRCKKMPKQLREWDAYHELKKEIEDFQTVLPLLTDLAKPSIMERHWRQVMELTGKNLPIDSDNFKLQQLINANLHEFRDEISDICESADKQQVIESKLNEINGQWSGMLFDFGTWKTRDYPCILAMGRVGELQEVLEETLMNLNTMNAMRHSIPFKEQLGTMLTTLSDTGDTIERWVKVQMLWTSLESVFTGGDIAKQMPMEAKKFQQIDKDWIKIMAKSADTLNVIQCCQNDMLKQLLPVLSVGLEACQKSLESYLEGKRNKFPRFFFTSDPVLLKILSQGSDPQNIQEDFEKLFDAISRVRFDKNDAKKITHIMDVAGTAEELVQLSAPVLCQGNIEDWLLALEAEMQKSIRRESRFCSHDTGAILNGMSIVEFGNRYIGQCCLLGIQLVWTSDCGDALYKFGRERDKAVMPATSKKQNQILADLVASCLTDLGSKMNRTKFETLVTIQVHQKDVFQDLWKKVKAHEIKDDQDFEWLKQTRFFWKAETDHCVISISDVDFTYSYEYLGCKERLCITPLTDRCYLALSQALGMFFGGAPAGPAGTGKTETTKDMGRSLGIYVVVTNCSDQHRMRDMATIFKGLCQSGLWGCFDEFNRIELEVLSVVAMQVEAICLAKKQNQKAFSFPGETILIKLIAAVGYFITMNPGYAGRQELPENLKVLFRGVCMMVPDRQIIMTVKLASQGYQQMDLLGKKFNVLYKLCEQQLSKQRHYDFGLRNILSVLRTAGSVKRSEPPESEEDMLFMRTARDMNLSKMVADDTPLFLALLTDLFPKVANPPKKVYEAIEKGSFTIMKRLKLDITCDTWFLKVIQLYETSLVRHGFMMVGPTMCGKTEVMATLTGCQTEDNQPTRIVALNPKAVTNQQLYGVKDPVSEEWTPGVFASIWQKYNNRALKYTTWITCDGPVDAIWIENLNTVLDDNKILTLANNDRIPMTDNCKIVFEVENLNNASPATVSRAGIIYVSQTDLGPRPITSTWLKRRTDHSANRDVEADLVGKCFEKYIETGCLWDFVLRNIQHVMAMNETVLMNQVLNMLDGQLWRHVEAGEVLSDIAYKRITIFAICWAIAGLCETDMRKKFCDKLTEIVTAAGDAAALPTCEEGMTIFEYVPDIDDKEKKWIRWAVPEWKPPKKLNFSSLLIPTLDSVRIDFIMTIQGTLPKTRTHFQSTLVVGSPGTAKTSTCLMYMAKFPLATVASKRVNYSSATTPFGNQKTIEAEVERKTGKTFCPPGGKEMIVFLDDLSMPIINTWGDQITNELTRQLMEAGGFYFLDKDKRGDFKSIEGLKYLGAMGHPGGGKNDIPPRLKSKFMCVNMVPPLTSSVQTVYGSILKASFTTKRGAKDDVIRVCPKLVPATIGVWDKVKKSLLPTPARFHYIFTMRELSRVFQGIQTTPMESITTELSAISLWRHECTRVFADKLARIVDKEFIDKQVMDFCSEHFGEEFAEKTSIKVAGEVWWADFQRDTVEDPDTGEDLGAPQIYEQSPSMKFIRGRAYENLTRFNEAYPAKIMNLVLFDDAMRHLMKINRTIQQKRGSAMLVGVGGSGKQSLARLAAFTSKHQCFQIKITKNYNDNALFEDVRGLYVNAGQKGLQVTFLLTDAEVKHEGFLEYMNSILATGEIAGLFQKDERDGMCGEVRNDFVKDFPNAEENLTNMYGYFLDRLKDNLHLVFCFSPVNAKFPIRAQKFPAVFSNVNINWFLPWPEEALIAVSSTFLETYKIDTPEDKKQKLYELMGIFQARVNDLCQVYLNRMRKHVYVTPKSYLCFIDAYKGLYEGKYEEVNVQERAVNMGLEKLNEAAADVEIMKVALAEEEKNLKVAEDATNKLLVKVQSETAKAEKKAAEVGVTKDECLANKAVIDGEKEEANKELQAAMPYVYEAESAAASIQPKDITELKTMKSPSDIIRLIFDGVSLLFMGPVCPVKPEPKTMNKVTTDFIHDSYDEFGKAVMLDSNFLKNLILFNKEERDNINDETCELLMPYLELENFNPKCAKSASGAAEGLCKWVGAMRMYHEAAKIVKPKLDYLKVQEGKMAIAMAELGAAEVELKKAQDILDGLNAQFNEAMSNKQALEDKANMTKRKMDQANKLINGLAGEKTRWTEDSNNFATRRKKLVGDCTLSCGFVTYCGPFNSEFRDKLNYDIFLKDTHTKGVPASEKVDLVNFLVDQGTIGEWNLEGLPSDDLSVQNGIMVTRSSRFPLMVDPQGQANRWIKSREAERIERSPKNTVTTLAAKNLKDQLEFTMGEGLCLLIENVENEVDPLLDPVLDKAIIKKGKNLYINVSDQNMDFSPKFCLYMTSRLPNPHFSPELSAKCTVIDFTVTLRGLEQQLLGRVIGIEQRSLEETLAALMEEVTNNVKTLQLLDKQLLDRLSNSTGNLLDDIELIEVLANTKAKAKEVEQKLLDAGEKKAEISEKREQYRPVATRGSVMYFCMTDMTLVSNPVTAQPSGWMYNCSLLQFLLNFDKSVLNSEKCQPTSKRVDKIIDFLTYQVYRYMNRGLFVRDQMMFKLLFTLNILKTSGQLTPNDIGMFLKAGAVLDIKSERQNPFKWMVDKVWLNILAISRHAFGQEQLLFFREIVDFISRNEAAWKKWYDENEPESCPVPDYEERLVMEKTLGPFVRLALVRCVREDRTVIGSQQFINNLLNEKFTAPVTDFIEDIYDESSCRVPVLYLLTAGSDPTAMIGELAKKKKKFPTDNVSMGEGQEVVAFEKMKIGFVAGTWVILQNCHLGIGFMERMEDILGNTPDIISDFRLWITCEITPRFPIGLLQMAIKVTLEPPMGLKAGLSRTYQTTVSQEVLDKIDNEKWRTLLYVLAFEHSIVQERRKFGPIGWCVPYEYNNADFEACANFLERYLSSTVTVGLPISWSTVQYMISEVQYGGRITDDLDRELFNTYVAKWFNDDVFKPNFAFNSYQADFNYKIPEGLEVGLFREYIDTLPMVDSPLIFGLHTNADLTYRQIESSTMLIVIQDTQPKDSGGEGGMTADEIVKEKCEETLTKMPPDFIEEIFREQIKKLKGPPNTTDKGFLAPLNIFLFQELERLQRIIAIVRNNLKSLSMAIDGTVVMTVELLEDLNAIFDARVPKRWTHDASGQEISWLLPNMGGWFTGLTERQIMLNTWLENGRGTMKGYWLTGFTNAQGFLTGMRQEVTRQHKRDQWALDDVITHSEIQSYDLERVKDVPEEGQNVHGLFIEGGRWNRAEMKLDECEPKKLFQAMPVIYLTGITLALRRTKGLDYGQYGPYDCPIYKYPKRNDRYLVFRILVKTEQHPFHWKLRGVSLMCQCE